MKEKDTSVIPKGHYCYTPDIDKNKAKDLNDDNYYINTCPYYESKKRGWCSFLDTDIFDQIKECSENA